jgi:hypothetical protein
MNSDQKPKFDVLFALRSSVWASFDQRRSVEWKVALGVWTAISSLIGILLTHDAKLNTWVKVGSAPFVLILLGLHLSYIAGVQETNRIDRDFVEYYDCFIEEHLLKPDFPSLLDSDEARRLKRLRRARAKQNVFTNYSHRFQLGVTLLLGLCLIAVVFSK